MWERVACSPRRSSGGIGRRGRLRVEHTITRICWRTPLVAQPTETPTPTTAAAVVVSQARMVGWGAQHGVGRRAGMAGVEGEVAGSVVGYTCRWFGRWSLLWHIAMLHYGGHEGKSTLNYSSTQWWNNVYILHVYINFCFLDIISIFLKLQVLSCFPKTIPVIFAVT